MSRCSSERVSVPYFTVLTFACLEKKPIYRACLWVFVFIMKPCLDDCLVRECREINFLVELPKQKLITKLSKELLAGV